MKIIVSYNNNSKKLEEKFEEFLKYYNTNKKIESPRKAG